MTSDQGVVKVKRLHDNLSGHPASTSCRVVAMLLALSATLEKVLMSDRVNKTHQVWLDRIENSFRPESEVVPFNAQARSSTRASIWYPYSSFRSFIRGGCTVDHKKTERIL